jgi:hypothetical protein
MPQGVYYNLPPLPPKNYFEMKEARDAAIAVFVIGTIMTIIGAMALFGALKSTGDFKALGRVFKVGGSAALLGIGSLLLISGATFFVIRKIKRFLKETDPFGAQEDCRDEGKAKLLKEHLLEGFARAVEATLPEENESVASDASVIEEASEDEGIEGPPSALHVE